MAAHPDVRARFLADLGFEPDPFQLRAIDAIDEGRSVLVAAPTGSGKTVVAEYAVATALAAGQKAFYTTPLKALSNQKYGDLVARHGPSRVGLLTGDNAINGEAPAVVMTTEVLRNMIYAGSSSLDGLRWVVLDEVHYLQNAYRGPVWEEVIIHLPPTVGLVCLSATVSNAEELTDWIETVRGPTTAVIEERRPVELNHLYLVGDRGSERLHLLPTLVDGLPNAEAAAVDARSMRYGGTPRGRGKGRLFTPRRVEVIDRLESENMLPAIYFIFSRAACNDAVSQCVRDGIRLTTPEERREIREVVDARLAPLSDSDLDVLGYQEWMNGLEHGAAAHHAGLVPPFKEAVEECFSRALVKVVFATETLALGINMPARSVVIEKLTKFTGERHEFLTPGEYTQITGRAGRRGIDDVGYAVALWSPFVPFDQVASLASKRTYALSSSFRPTYNMAANLVRRYPADVAHHLLNLSFAQYRADADVVRLEREIERTGAALAHARAEARCERGDVDEFRKLLRDAVRGRARGSRDVRAAIEQIAPGDVILLGDGKRAERVAVIATSQRKGGETKLRTISGDRKGRLLSAEDFDQPPRTIGRIDLPVPYAPHQAGFQKAVAHAVMRARVRPVVPDAPAPFDGGHPSSGAARSADSHPVSACPDAVRHVKAAERAERLARDLDRLERSVKGRTESLARQFDRVLRVLEAWGYVDGWALTDAGNSLAGLYHECDLLVAEAIRAGLLDGLDPASVAGLVSAFTYETRGPDGPSGVWFPSSRARERWARIERLAADLNGVEEDAGLPQTRPPDPGFVALAHAWAAGEDLDEVLAGEEISGGDFVRNVKTLIDLLRQVGDVAGDPATGRAARAAADRLFRGVVAASSVVAGRPA